MAQIYIPGWLYFRLEMQIAGQTVLNTVSYKYSGTPPSPPVLLTLAQDWWTQVGTPYRQIANTALRFVSVTVRDLGAPTGGEAVFQIPPNTFGQAPGEAHAMNGTGVISWRSNTVGRAGRGRLFTTGLSEPDQTAGTLLNAWLTLTSALAQAITGFQGNQTITIAHVIASRRYQVLHVVTGVIIDNLVDSMRKRLLNRGR